MPLRPKAADWSVFRSPRPRSASARNPGRGSQPDIPWNSRSADSATHILEPHRKRVSFCHDSRSLSDSPALRECLRRAIGRRRHILDAHWAHLIESLREIGPEELGRRCLRAERRIRENGITYNIYSDPLGANRPWEIDIVPFLISAEEWRYIEEGIIQRARLLSMVLEDLYGAQDLLASGRFPAELLYANPAFLRPMVGVRVPAHSYLHMLAIDLARSPDGQWWVLSDRTQAPSGSGYALENRTIVADVLPNVFRSSNVFASRPFSARNAMRLPPSLMQQSAHRPVDSRPAQRDLLRTLLSCPIPGFHSGGGSGPHGSRPPRLSQDR